MAKLTKTQRAVLERMTQGQRIVYFPPTQSAWFYLDPVKPRVRLRNRTFFALANGGYIQHTETVTRSSYCDYYYDITLKGRAAVFTL